MADDVQGAVHMEQGAARQVVDSGGEVDVLAGGALKFEGSKRHMAKVALSADTGAGGVLGWQNPESAAILVDRIILDVTTPATGTPNVDVGTATDATTSGDNLIDGAAIGSAAVVLDNIDDQGTNGTSAQRLDEAGGTTDHVTASASADPAGLVGNAFIFYTVA